MTSLLRAIRGSIAYVAAGASQGRRDHEAAIARIENAKRLIRGTARKPTPFYIHLRAAHIYFDAGIPDKSRENLTKAMETIKNLSRIDEVDRNYLLDYCDLLAADISKDRGRVELRVDGGLYGKVNPRYRKEYPIIWKDA